MLLGGTDRVQEQLTVLAADVTLTRARIACQQIVAVDDAGPREGTVVHADQAHDAVRHRAHWHQAAHRQRAGAEAGPRGPAGEACIEQRGDVGAGEPNVGLARGLRDIGEFTAQLCRLPGL